MAGLAHGVTGNGLAHRAQAQQGYCRHEAEVILWRISITLWCTAKSICRSGRFRSTSSSASCRRRSGGSWIKGLKQRLEVLKLRTSRFRQQDRVVSRMPLTILESRGTLAGTRPFPPPHLSSPFAVLLPCHEASTIDRCCAQQQAKQRLVRSAVVIQHGIGRISCRFRPRVDHLGSGLAAGAHSIGCCSASLQRCSISAR